MIGTPVDPIIGTHLVPTSCVDSAPCMWSLIYRRKSGPLESKLNLCTLIFGGSNLIWHWIWKNITFIAQLIYALKPKRRLQTFNIQPADLWSCYSTTAATRGTRSWRLRWVAGKFSTGAGVVAELKMAAADLNTLPSESVWNGYSCCRSGRTRPHSVKSGLGDFRFVVLNY